MHEEKDRLESVIVVKVSQALKLRLAERARVDRVTLSTHVREVLSKG